MCIAIEIGDIDLTVDLEQTDSFDIDLTVDLEQTDSFCFDNNSYTLTLLLHYSRLATQYIKDFNKLIKFKSRYAKYSEA